ncbi:hypothetical protein EOM86_01980 [Candidatus Nomurabacteria bacterium]|jgi:hypothetical protein|nr:hypothetical protein [Candidatus Nomurabacteria bacterium]
MKWFSKINRGAILTAAVLLCVVIYLVVLSITQKASVPELKKICEAYIELDVKYSMLPSEQRKSTPDITDDQLDEYINEMENELSVFYPSGEQYSEFALNAKSALLKKQAAGQSVTTEYAKEIIRYQNFVFKDDTVTVTLLTETSIERAGQSEKDIYAAGKMEMTDSIILMKFNGQWKIIHAEINQPGDNYSEYPYYK